MLRDQGNVYQGRNFFVQPLAHVNLTTPPEGQQHPPKKIKTLLSHGVHTPRGLEGSCIQGDQKHDVALYVSYHQKLWAYSDEGTASSSSRICGTEVHFSFCLFSRLHKGQLQQMEGSLQTAGVSPYFQIRSRQKFHKTIAVGKLPSTCQHARRNESCNFASKACYWSVLLFWYAVFMLYREGILPGKRRLCEWCEMEVLFLPWMWNTRDWTMESWFPGANLIQLSSTDSAMTMGCALHTVVACSRRGLLKGRRYLFPYLGLYLGCISTGMLDRIVPLSQLEKGNCKNFRVVVEAFSPSLIFTILKHAF